MGGSAGIVERESIHSQTLARKDVARAADLLRLLANPRRLALVRLLGEGEQEVGRIGELLGLGQPNVSQHLGLLRTAGLVESRRQGHRVTNRLSTPLLAALCALACHLADEMDSPGRPYGPNAGPTQPPGVEGGDR